MVLYLLLIIQGHLKNNEFYEQRFVVSLIVFLESSTLFPTMVGFVEEIG